MFLGLYQRSCRLLANSAGCSRGVAAACPEPRCPATSAACSFTTTANNTEFCSNTLHNEDYLSDLGRPQRYEIADDGPGLTAPVTSNR